MGCLRFHVRQKVAAAVETLHKQDIIEPIEGPTPNFAPFLGTPIQMELSVFADKSLPTAYVG